MSTNERRTAPTTLTSCLTTALRVALLGILTTVSGGTDAAAQVCPGTTVASDLRRAMGMALSNQGNLIVSETGTPLAHSGRISILETDGTRRTLIDGLPSGINDVREPSGPAGILMRGRTIYVLISIGDSVVPAPVPTRHLANPNVSSPIYSSVLAIHFSAGVEKRTSGFTMSLADQRALAAGEEVILSNGGGDTIEIELVTNFPDYIPDPLPGNPNIVRASNPFDLALAGNQLYVTDGGRNLVWTVDIPTGTHAPLTTFGTIPNPIFPVGGTTVMEAVPTGIEYIDGQLLVTLFRGVPFAPGTSTVMQVDPSTGVQAALISGLKTAIGVLQISERGDGDYLVLQHSSGGPFFPGPGLVLRFESPDSAPVVIANCLTRPTSMLFDEKSGTLYVTELLSGRLVALR